MTDKIREKLLPCPFCGHSTPFIQNTHRDIRWMVYCEGCGASIKERISAEECVRLWNTRTNTANAEARELVKMANLHLNNALHELNLDRNDISKLEGGAIVSSSINHLRMIGTQINLAQEQLTKWLEEGK